MPLKEKERLVSEGNTCIGLGIGVGAIGASMAAVAGNLCPLCVVVAPALVGVGIIRKLQAKSTDSTGNSAEYGKYLSRANELAKLTGIDTNRVADKEKPAEGLFIREYGTTLILYKASPDNDELLCAGNTDELLQELFYHLTLEEAVKYFNKAETIQQNDQKAVFERQRHLLSLLDKEWEKDLELEILARASTDDYMERGELHREFKLYTTTELVKMAQSEQEVYKSNEKSSIGEARISILNSICSYLAKNGFPDTLQDKRALSLIPYYFQEANYDDIDWTSREADLSHLATIFEIDFAVQSGGCPRKAASKRMFRSYISKAVYQDK